MATHLVTGGAGFLGSLMARALHARGERVRILDLLDAPELPEGIEHVRGDILDEALLTAAMQDIDVVHHHAAMVPLTKSATGFARVNTDGTAAALASAKRAGVRFFIHVSTSAVYGLPAACPLTEASPLVPIEAYGRSKLDGERLVEAARRDGLPCAIVRPRTLIGHERLGIFEILFEWIIEGRRIYVLGNGRQPYQLLHVQDAIDAMLRMAERRRPGVYLIGTNRFTTLRQDLDALIAHAGTRSRVTGLPAAPAIAALRLFDTLGVSPLAPWHYRTYHKPFFFDVAPTMAALDWQPRFSNAEALIDSFEWYVAHRATVRAARGSTHRSSVPQGVLGLLRRLS